MLVFIIINFWGLRSYQNKQLRGKRHPRQEYYSVLSSYFRFPMAGDGYSPSCRVPETNLKCQPIAFRCDFSCHRGTKVVRLRVCEARSGISTILNGLSWNLTSLCFVSIPSQVWKISWVRLLRRQLWTRPTLLTSEVQELALGITRSKHYLNSE